MSSMNINKMGKMYKLMKILMPLYLLSCLHYVNSILGGGKVTTVKTRNEWGFLVPVIYDDAAYHCSGTIIMPQWILTSAKCVHEGNIGVRKVLGIKLGITSFSDEGKLVKVEKYFAHPYFLYDPDSGTSVNDIAIMKLDQSLEFGLEVHPVEIGLEPINQNLRCETAGWGATKPYVYEDTNVFHREYYDSPPVLKAITLFIESITVCKDVLGIDFKEAINIDFTACARVFNFDKDTTERAVTDNSKNSNRYSRESDRTKHSYLWPYPSSDNGTDWFGLDNLRSSGPSFGDEGGPLIYRGKQIGIFAFPLHIHDRKEIKCFSAWTRLDRYILWMNDIILKDMGNITQSRVRSLNYSDLRANQLGTSTQRIYNARTDIWDNLSSASCICSYHFIVLIFLFLL